MSEIEETVAKAIAQKQLDEGDGLYDWYALTDEVADGYRYLARAAIEAYEAAKREDLDRALLNTSKQLTSSAFDDFTASQNMRYGMAEKTTPLDSAYFSAMMKAGFKP